MPSKKPAKKAQAKRSAPEKRVGMARPGGGRTRGDDGEYGARADKATGELAVVEKIASLKGAVRDVAAKLHDVVMEAAPDLEPAVKWGMPVYSRKGPVCYAAPYDAYVRFGFYDRTGLDGLDAGDGKGGSIKLASVEDLDEARVAKWVRTAAKR